MSDRSGLRKQVKTVRTRKGTARRTYWVKGDSSKRNSPKGIVARTAQTLSRHKGKIMAGVGAAAALGAAYYTNRESVKGGLRSARKATFGGRHEGESLFGHASRVLQKARGGAKMGHMYDQKRRKDALAAGHWGARTAVRAGHFMHSEGGSSFIHGLGSMVNPLASAAHPAAAVATQAVSSFGQQAIRGAGRRLLKRHGVKPRED